MTIANNLNKWSSNLVTVLHHKVTLIFTTLAIAICTSTFAFAYGFDYNWQYGLLFAIALFSLTFHFSKKIPKDIVKGMEVVSIIGLILVTIFVSIGAFLSAGTSQSDPEIEAAREHISSLESQIARKEWAIKGLMFTKNPANARKVEELKTTLELELSSKRNNFAALLKSKGIDKYESGQLAIFGHLKEFTGWEQETVNLVFMWFIVTVFTCMEISKGAAIYRDQTKKK